MLMETMHKRRNPAASLRTPEHPGHPGPRGTTPSGQTSNPKLNFRATITNDSDKFRDQRQKESWMLAIPLLEKSLNLPTHIPQTPRCGEEVIINAQHARLV